MSEILSQQEIDELLSQLTGGGGDASAEKKEEKQDQYRVHDFRTANKFSREQMRTLNVIFENYGYMLSTRLTGMMRTVCDVKLVSIEELVFSEFNNALATTSVLAVIDAPPLQGSLLMQLSTPIAYAMIVRMLGGVADYADIEKKFTEIELAVVENMVAHMLDVFAESWDKIVNIKPSLQRLETSAQFAQIAALNEPTAVVTLSVKIDSVEEIIAFCIPHYVIQPVAKKLSTMMLSFSETMRHSNQEPQTDAISKRLEDTVVKLSAVLDTCEMALEDVLLLKPGEVLRLDHNVNEYIKVNIEHIPKFLGIIGISGNKQVVQIADVIKENNNGEQ